MDEMEKGQHVLRGQGLLVSQMTSPVATLGGGERSMVPLLL